MAGNERPVMIDATIHVPAKFKISSIRNKAEEVSFFGFCDPCLFSYCHFTASATTTKPVVVQQDNFTVLFPALKLQVPRCCHDPPLTC